MHKNMIMIICSAVCATNVSTCMQQRIIPAINKVEEPSIARCNLMAGLSLHCPEVVKREIQNNPSAIWEYKLVKFSPNFESCEQVLYLAPIHEVVALDDIYALEIFLQKLSPSVLVSQYSNTLVATVVNQPVKETRYPSLYFARSKAVLKLLCKYGADIGAKDRDNRSLVKMALFRPTEPAWVLADFLLKKKRCNIHDPIDKYKNTLLHKAVRIERPDIVGFLLRRGANPQLRNNRALSSFQSAKSSKNGEVIALFNQIASRIGLVPNIVIDWEGNTPLHKAVIQKDYKNIELLIRIGFDITAKNYTGLTAFKLALQGGDGACIELFKKIFANVFVNTESYMPEYKNRKDFLINHFGINTALDKDGTTLLHMAVSANKYDKCITLLKNGANANALMIGMSPLFVALVNGHTAIAALLLNFGATVTERLTNWDLPDYVHAK